MATNMISEFEDFSREDQERTLVFMEFRFSRLDDPNFKFTYSEAKSVFLIIAEDEEYFTYIPKSLKGQDLTMERSSIKKLERELLDELVYEHDNTTESFGVWSLGKNKQELLFRADVMREKIQTVLENKEKANIQMQNVFYSSTGRRAGKKVAAARTVALCINCYWWNYRSANEGICGAKGSRMYKQVTQNNQHCNSFRVDG